MFFFGQCIVKKLVLILIIKFLYENLSGKNINSDSVKVHATLTKPSGELI